MRITFPPRLICLAVLLAATPVAAQMPASDLPPGLDGARLLAGWTNAEGDRVMALELLLQPGWKTYWRSPGDTGLPPQFAWAGSRNMAGVTLHWPAPQVIRSGDATEMGYRDRLVLPLTVHAADPAQPVQVAAQIDLGLCENICVPARLDLIAPPPGDRPDPAITMALAQQPLVLDTQAACAVTDLPDGLRVAMTLPDFPVALAAIELADQPRVWVSGAQIEDGQAVAEMIGPTAAPFALDPDMLRLTVIPADGGRASQITGCAP